MQDPSSLYTQIKAQLDHPQPQFPEQEHLKCPRCDSSNTKFCYFNNYNLSQPRHYCKSCRRYWTKGGALRNVPIGGGSRKNAKRSSAASASASKRSPHPAMAASVSDTQSETKSGNGGEITETAMPIKGKGDTFVGHIGNLLDGSESFGSLLGASGGQFGHFLNGMGPNGSNLVDYFGDPGPGQNMDPLVYNHGEHGGDCWGGGGVWPDPAAIYTSRSYFHFQ